VARLLGRRQTADGQGAEGAKSHVTWSSVTRLDGRSPEMGICRWWRRRREAGGGEAKRAAGRPASRHVYIVIANGIRYKRRRADHRNN